MSTSFDHRSQSASDETVHGEGVSPVERDSDEPEANGLCSGVVCRNQNDGNCTRTSETLNSCSRLSGVIDSVHLKQVSSSDLRHDQTITTVGTLHTNENQPADEVNERLGNAGIIGANVLSLDNDAHEAPSRGADLTTDSLVYCRIEGGVSVSGGERSENRKKTASGSLIDPATKTEASAAGTGSEKTEGAAAGGEEEDSQRTFDQGAIEDETKQILRRTLCDLRYEPNSCKVIGHQLAGKILKRIIRLCPKRYKLVIFVSIGSLCDRPGIQFGSRCLWDAETDLLATVRFANDSLFAVAMVYALCTD